MISKHPNSVRSLLYFPGALAAVAIVLSGCGAKTGEPAPAAPAIESPAPAAEKPTAPDFTATLAKVAASEDMIAWYTVRQEYMSGAERSPEVDSALSAKEAELLAKVPVRPINDALDLVAFNWKLDGTASAEGQKETFAVTWMFKKKQAIQFPAGEDVQLILRGWPDKAHQHYLEGVGQADNKYFELSYGLKPKLAEWKEGEYQIVEQKTYKKLPNVPFRIHTFFSQLKKNDEGKWVYVGPYGQRPDLGWFADLGATQAP